jgi:hypothetical protein
VPSPAKKSVAEVRWVIVPKPGEQVSGDGAWYDGDSTRLRLFLGDGLGHGPEAHFSVQSAIVNFKKYDGDIPSETLRYLHPLLKKTRGLVGTAATYNYKEKLWRICGIGNIATRTHATASKNHMSYNGVIGMNIPNTLNEQLVPQERGQVIILCSDGIKTRWELQKYVGIFKFDLSVLAAAIYKDFGRRTDDMSVLVARINNI